MIEINILVIPLILRLSNTKNINKKVKIVVVSNDTEDLKTELEVSIKGIM